MSHLFLALLWAAPLVMGHHTYEVSQPAPAPAAVYRVSMGCDAVDCVDPTHYHLCTGDCTDQTHYHDCPVGCADPAHPHHTGCWETNDAPGEVICPSVDCDVTDCVDPAHYHYSESHHSQSQSHHGSRHH